MQDYVLELQRPMDKHIRETLEMHGCNIVFHDDELLPEMLVVESNNTVFAGYDFIKSYRKTRNDGVSLVPRPIAASTKVTFKPGVDLSELNNRGHGFGVKVAVLDLGIFTDICGSVADQLDFTGTSKEPADEGTHGSIVVSIIKQIARAAQIHTAKVCHKDGTMKEVHLLTALKWAKEKNFPVINISVGYASACDGTCSICRYVSAIVEKNKCIIVTAAGNHKKGIKLSEFVHCPACSDEAITVGSLTPDGEDAAPFSSSGHTNTNKPNILAHGCGSIISPAYASDYQGTSFAAPVITGIMACLVSYIGSTDSLKMRLYETAKYLDGTSVFKQGHGMIDLPKLLEVLDSEKTRSGSASTQSK